MGLKQGLAIGWTAWNLSCVQAANIQVSAEAEVQRSFAHVEAHFFWEPEAAYELEKHLMERWLSRHSFL